MSWTGGKDCNLALLAAWRDASLRVAALVVFRPEGAVFRAHPLCLMEAQAASLGLPLVHVVIPRDPPSYKEPLPPHSHAHAHAHAHTHTHAHALIHTHTPARTTHARSPPHPCLPSLP